MSVILPSPVLAESPCSNWWVNLDYDLRQKLSYLLVKLLASFISILLKSLKATSPFYVFLTSFFFLPFFGLLSLNQSDL